MPPSSPATDTLPATVQEDLLRYYKEDYQVILHHSLLTSSYHQYELFVQPKWPRVSVGREGSRTSLLLLRSPGEVEWLAEGVEAFMARLPAEVRYRDFSSWEHALLDLTTEAAAAYGDLLLHPPALRELSPLEHLLLLLLGGELLSPRSHCGTLTTTVPFLLQAWDWNLPCLKDLPPVFHHLPSKECPPSFFSQCASLTPLNSYFARPSLTVLACHLTPETGGAYPSPKEAGELLSCFASARGLPFALLGTQETRQAWVGCYSWLLAGEAEERKRERVATPPPPVVGVTPLRVARWWAQEAFTSPEERPHPFDESTFSLPWHPFFSATGKSLAARLESLPLGRVHRHLRPPRATTLPSSHLMEGMLLEVSPSQTANHRVLQELLPEVEGRECLFCSHFAYWNTVTHAFLEALLPEGGELSLGERKLLVNNLANTLTEKEGILLPRKQHYLLPGDQAYLLPLLQEHLGPLAAARLLISLPPEDGPLTYDEVTYLLAHREVLAYPPSWWRDLAKRD